MSGPGHEGGTAAALLANYDAQCQAMVAGDADALGALLSDDFVLVHMTGYRQTKAEWLADVRSGAMTYHAMEDVDVSVDASSGVAALTARTRTEATIWGAHGTWPLQLQITFERRRRLMGRGRDGGFHLEVIVPGTVRDPQPARDAHLVDRCAAQGASWPPGTPRPGLAEGAAGQPTGCGAPASRQARWPACRWFRCCVAGRRVEPGYCSAVSESSQNGEQHNEP